VVRELVARFQPDLIHLQDPVAICKNLLKAAKKHKIPVVITNHFSLDYILAYVASLRLLHPVMRKMLSSHLAKFYNRCDCVLCPTETVKKDLQAMGVRRPIEAISNGVALERFYAYQPPHSIRLKYHLPRNPLVLYVGRIDKDKSLEVLLQAVPKVVEETNAHFVLVGNGTVLPKLKKMVEKQSLERFVSFLGPIQHDSEALPGIYQSATVLLIPSAVETQSIVTLEAMASGLPIVAARAGALPELVEDGVNGFLFPPDDAEEAAKETINILQNPVLAQQMGEKSLKMVAAHRIEESFRRIKRVYEEVTGK
jgi:glycosyltransferase involved in cell wall biosynthesis